MTVKWAVLAPFVALGGVVAVTAARAQAIESGQVLPDVTLRRVDGGSAPLVDRAAAATAVVFFRAPHERSEETLRMLAACQPRLAGKPVRVVGVVPADAAEAARASAEAAGAKLPVLVDAGDVVYSAAGARTHPAIVIVDRARKVVAFEPYHQVGSCEIVVARIRRALGEIDDAEVARILSPAASELPGDSPAAVAHRHVALGRKLLAGKAYPQAHESARKAIALAPTAEAWRLEGEVFAAEGRCPDALHAFDAALAVAPGDPETAAVRRTCAR
jgi:hypothetical protein